MKADDDKNENNSSLLQRTKIYWKPTNDFG